MLIVAALFFVSFLSAIGAVCDFVDWRCGEPFQREDEPGRRAVTFVLGIGQFLLLLYLLYHYGALIERAWMAGR